MSRVTPIAVGGLGISSVLTSTALLLYKEKKERDRMLAELMSYRKDVFNGVTTFKTSANTSECVGSYFGNDFEIDSQVGDLAAANIKVPEEQFFKNPTTYISTSSCLTINWVKDTNAEGKWKGTFNWIWTFMRDDEGFINFNVIDTTEDKKLSFTGTFYLLKKEHGKWTTKYKKEIDWSNATIENKQFDTHFPKASSHLESQVKGKYWGFINSIEELDNICEGNGCPTNTTANLTTYTFQWNTDSSTNNTQQLKDWTECVKWWRNIYSLSKWNLGDKISNFRGTWAKR